MKRICIVMLISILVGFALAEEPVSKIPTATKTVAKATQYLDKDNQFTPQYYRCGSYTGWFTDATYCDTAARCANCIPPLDGRFEDQYRYKICTDTVTGKKTRDYEFRTRSTGCCGRCYPF